MHSCWRLWWASEIGIFQFHFAKNENAECQQYSCTDSCVHEIGKRVGPITASIPVQNDEPFLFHSSLKAICRLVQLRLDRWHKKRISRLRPTSRLLPSPQQLNSHFFIRSFYFKVLLFPTTEPGPRLLPQNKFCLDLIWA